jgi:hypothetical protein
VFKHPSFLLPQPTAGGQCLAYYTASAGIFQPENLPDVHGCDRSTTVAGKTRHLTQPNASFFTFAPTLDHRSAPPRAPIEIARRRGLAVAAAAMDAGLSAPVLRP